MKSITRFSILVFFICQSIFSPNFLLAQNDYFFPKGSKLDEQITSPEGFLGYAIGDWHTRYDRMVSYMEELARQSEKVHFQIIGYTNELRPQIVLTITNPENYQRLEAIREEHLKLSKGDGEAVNLDKMPVILLLGYNVHGNEPSSTEAAMLTAYYLAASTDAETQNFLENAVIFVDPAYNPDGRDRHAHWVDMHKGNPPVADPLDREHNEAWPGGRTNHYWFDLNRDWLPLSQVESRNRMRFYHQWLPNVATDYHEMGTNGTYFFEPTKPYGSENPLVPRKNYDELNQLFAGYFEAALDEIGSLYFTKEAFDNFYPGYGSTYPDMQGGLGLLFEEASSRGHLQKTTMEDLTFAFTIRNQTRTGIATVRAAVENRELLLRYQQEFFQSAISESQKQATKAYLFGDSNDQSRTRAFANLLLQHHIKTFKLQKAVHRNGKTFEPGKAFLVPAEQVQYRMVETFFEPVSEYYDSVFYDASAWMVALAFDMPYERLSGKLPTLGNELQFDDLKPKPRPVPKASYAYLFDWSDYFAPEALWFLQQKGIYSKVAFQPFTIGQGGDKKEFGYGSILVPVAGQKISPEELHSWVSQTAALAGIDVFTVSTGITAEGADLGSRSFRTVKRPKVAMLIGEGMSGYEAGEIWHLLDTKVHMPITKVDITDFNRLQLKNYNTLILVSGNYKNLTPASVQKIRSWAKEGGTLISLRTATKWLIEQKLVKEKLRKATTKKDSLLKQRFDFDTARDRLGSKRIGGSIYQTDVDITHPLGFGYHDRILPVYRNHRVFLEPSANSFSTVVEYTDKPHLDGYIHPDNLKLIKNSASLLVSKMGRGRAILFADNPNFRGFWYGTNRLFFNALFFGSLIALPE